MQNQRPHGLTAPWFPQKAAQSRSMFVIHMFVIHMHILTGYVSQLSNMLSNISAQFVDAIVATGRALNAQIP